jgi:hypothetical protein
MKHLFKFNLLIFALTFVFFACNKKKDNPTPSNSNNGNPGNVSVTFLKEGAHYIYDYDSFFGSDTVGAFVEKQLAQDTFLVRYYTTIDGIYPTQYYVLHNGELSSSFRLRDPASYQVLCKFNQPVGTSWTITSGSYIYTCTIDSVNAKVITGKGMVTDAVKVKLTLNGTSQSSYNYYSPSVGILGTGNYGSTASMQLKDYTLGTTTGTTPPSKLPAITFGSFPFLKVANYWRYNITTLSGSDVLKVQINSKSSQGVYAVSLTYESDNSTSTEYWFEDNGYLMVYEAGEKIYQADPIYMNPSSSKVGYGWTGLTSSGSTFIYKISDLSATASSTAFGSLSCMQIDVSNGVFSSQSNYWNANKGQVSIDGLQTMDAIESNAKSGSQKHEYIPGFTL